MREGAQGGGTGESASGLANSMRHRREFSIVKRILEVDPERLARSEFYRLNLRSRSRGFFGAPTF